MELNNIRKIFHFKNWAIHPVKRRIAKYYLWFLQTFLRVKVIGITGSVGKTTTKEMIASVLSQKYKVVSSFANIDPVYNIPTTILKCRPNIRMLVLEMGIEHPGEMDFYLWLARPKIGILTNIYWTHTEFLGDIEGVFREKSKMIRALPKSGWAVLNRDDELVLSIRDKTRAKVLLFGREGICNVGAKDLKIREDFKTEFTLSIDGVGIPVQLPVLGEHFVTCALAAAAVGYLETIPLSVIKKGLEQMRFQPHRMIPVQSKSGGILLDDTYNSSPLGAKAAIDTLLEVGKGKTKIAVLGDMLELGNYEEEGHMEVGEYVAKHDVDILVCLGERAIHMAEGARRGKMDASKIVIVPDKKEAIKFLKSIVNSRTVVLFKASRKLAFEELVEECRRF